VAPRAPILGIAGLIFVLFGLLSHWFTYNPMVGFFSFGWYSLAHLVVGAVCLAWYFTKGSASLGQFVRQRSTRYGLNALVYSVLFVAVIAMINFMGARYNKRIDMSAAGVNTLSDQSLAVLDGLDSEVTIEAFMTGGRDPVLEELFGAYRYRSDQVSYSFVDPQIRPELAQQAGISQVPTLKISKGERSTLVTKTDEESVTNGIHRVTAADIKKIYFIEGHGEPGIADPQSPAGLGLFAQDLKNQNYEVAKLFLPDVESAPEDAAVIIAPAAEKAYFPHEIDLLQRYLESGGRLLMLLEPRGGDEIVEMLARWGIEVGSNVVVDQQIRLFQGVTLGLEPVVSTYGSHPSVEPMTERTLFSLARSVQPAAEPPTGVTVTSLASTARTSWAESDIDRLFDQSEAQLDEGDIAGPVSIAVAAGGKVADVGGEGDAEFGIVVFGDGSFVTNNYWRQLFNDALALSTVGWLSGQDELISIGPRAVRASRAHLTPAQHRTVFYLSVLVVPELILLCGIAVWWRRSSL